MLQNENVFDPALLSFEDCDFLLNHADEAPIVARRSFPAACNKTAMEWVERFYSLNELEKAGKAQWRGVEAIKASIRTYLGVRAKWAADEQYGAPPLPSRGEYDSRGKWHESAPGSDTGVIKTYFDAEGKRLPFAVPLFGERATAFVPAWVAKRPKQVDSLTEDVEKALFTCSICNKTETYRPESRSSRAAARSRMSKHLRNAETEKDRHLELHTLEFNS